MPNVKIYPRSGLQIAFSDALRNGLIFLIRIVTNWCVSTQGSWVKLLELKL
jgi:hypothetical protein